MKRIIILLVVVQWTLSVFAQTGEKVLMTIDKTDTVTANEFNSIYLKNNYRLKRMKNWLSLLKPGHSYRYSN